MAPGKTPACQVGWKTTKPRSSPEHFHVQCRLQIISRPHSTPNDRHVQYRASGCTAAVTQQQHGDNAPHPIPEWTGAVTRQHRLVGIQTWGGDPALPDIKTSCPCPCLASFLYASAHLERCPCGQSRGHGIPTARPLSEPSIPPCVKQPAGAMKPAGRTVCKPTLTSHSCLLRLAAVDAGPRKSMTKDVSSRTCYDLTIPKRFARPLMCAGLQETVQRRKWNRPTSCVPLRRLSKSRWKSQRKKRTLGFPVQR